MRPIWLVSLLLCLLAGPPALAQYGREKWELTPFVGYETSGSYPLNPTTSRVLANDLRVDGAISFGTFIDYSLGRDFGVEFMWDRNPTSYSVQPLPHTPYFKAYDSTID